LWPLRARLVEQGAVPEAEALRSGLEIEEAVSAGWAQPGQGEANAATLFVPGRAALGYDPGATDAGLWAARAVAGSVAVRPEALDSGCELLAVGLPGEAARALAGVRRAVEETGSLLVLAGTSGEAAALAEGLAGVQVEYVGAALARAGLAGRVSLDEFASAGKRFGLHPSAAFRKRPEDFDVIEQWLRAWLGADFRPEPEALKTAWPAAVERMAIGLDPALARRLAKRRMGQMLRLGVEVILTTDPYSNEALSAVAPDGVKVRDLLSFAAENYLEA
jgi:hypothetical protein